MLEERPRNLEYVFNLLKDRKGIDPEKSYTANLYRSGKNFINKKVMEEAFEFTQAENKKAIINEFCDLLYHSYVLLNHANVSYQEMEREMLKRTGMSGLAEKKNRQPKK